MGIRRREPSQIYAELGVCKQMRLSPDRILTVRPIITGACEPRPVKNHWVNGLRGLFRL